MRRLGAYQLPGVIEASLGGRHFLSARPVGGRNHIQACLQVLSGVVAAHLELGELVPARVA